MISEIIHTFLDEYDEYCEGLGSIVTAVVGSNVKASPLIKVTLASFIKMGSNSDRSTATTRHPNCCAMTAVHPPGLAPRSTTMLLDDDDDDEDGRARMHSIPSMSFR
jgi:hypothetical protein